MGAVLSHPIALDVSEDVSLYDIVGLGPQQFRNKAISAGRSPHGRRRRLAKRWQLRRWRHRSTLDAAYIAELGILRNVVRHLLTSDRSLSKRVGSGHQLWLPGYFLNIRRVCVCEYGL
jgi:hypothetical protein